MRLSEQWRKKKQEKPEEGTTIAELVAIPCEFADKLADAVDQRDALLVLYREYCKWHLPTVSDERKLWDKIVESEKGIM